MNELRKICEVIRLKDLSYSLMKEVLKDIAKKENFEIDEGILVSIAIKSKGDLRAAINDLHSVSRMKDPSLIVLDERNKENNIFDVLKLILKGKPTNETTQILESLNMSLDDVILWMEENICREYKGKELYKAYELLAKVDVFRGRIYKQQYWRFLT